MRAVRRQSKHAAGEAQCYPTQDLSRLPAYWVVRCVPAVPPPPAAAAAAAEPPAAALRLLAHAAAVAAASPPCFCLFCSWASSASESDSSDSITWRLLVAFCRWGCCCGGGGSACGSGCSCGGDGCCCCCCCRGARGSSSSAPLNAAVPIGALAFPALALRRTPPREVVAPLGPAPASTGRHHGCKSRFCVDAAAWHTPALALGDRWLDAMHAKPKFNVRSMVNH